VSNNGHNGWLRLLPQVEGMIVEQGIVVPGWRAGQAERKRFQDHLARALAGSHLVSDDAQVVEAAGVLARASTGLGVLEEIAAQPGVEEIIVRRGQVQVERYGRIEELGALAGDDYFERLARRVADLGGRAMKADRPFVLVDLPNGSRFTAMIPPLSVEGTAINVRVFRQEALSLHSLAQGGTFDDPDRGPALEMLPDDLEPNLPEMARFLAWTMRDNAATVLISGEFSSGKTTLLNALTAYIAPLVAHVTCTDIAPEMLEKAKARLQGFVHVDYRVEDACALSFEENSFDVVLCCNVLHQLSRPEMAAREFRRVLRPSGKLLAITLSMGHMSLWNKLRTAVEYVLRFGIPPAGSPFSRSTSKVPSSTTAGTALLTIASWS